MARILKMAFKRIAKSNLIAYGGKVSQIRRGETVYVRGNLGLGDSFMQRAVIRQLLDRGAHVFYETPWPSVCWDLHARGDLKFIAPVTRARTQAKNATRQADAYTSEHSIPPNVARITTHYNSHGIHLHRGVLYAILAVAGANLADDDFTMRPRFDWTARAEAMIREWQPTKPLLMLRQLTVRTEWKPSYNRNPLAKPFGELYKQVRDRFFVVSIADVAPPAERLDGPELDADVCFHRGELECELLMALMAKCAMVFTSPGFAICMAQALRRPTISVFGGFDTTTSFERAWRCAHFDVEPRRPCWCLTGGHNCDREIDLKKYLQPVAGFAALHAQRRNHG